VKRFSKTLVAGVAAGALAVSGLAITLTAGPASATTTSRVGGANRYDTARLAALANFPGGSATAVLASGENFPDGLAAADLAGSLSAPLLLTPAASLAPETVSALATLHVHTVYVVGGTAAVSAAVIAQLQGLGYIVPAAIAGADRYATAAAVATASTASAPIGTVGGKKTAILASGANFPDALAAGSASYAAHLPILLTDPNTLSAATSAAITSLGITNVLIAGGTSAVSAAVETAVKALAGGTVTTARLAGADRFATSVAIASFDVNAVISGGLGMSTANIVLASGLNFPDALVASEFKSPVVLDDALPASVATWLGTIGSAAGNILALGGTSAVADADLAAAQAAANPTGGAATITAVAGATSFTVTFSVAVNTPVAANFTLNNGAAGAGIGVPAATTTPNQFLVPVNAPLKPGDVIAINAGQPPTTPAGLPVSGAAFTVPANSAPTVVSTNFEVGGMALSITFNKPVTTIGGAGTPAAMALPAIAVSGAMLTAGAASADGTTLEYTSNVAFTQGSVLTVTGGLNNAGNPAGIEDQTVLGPNGNGVPMAASYTTTPTTNTVAPTIIAASVTAGTPVQGHLAVATVGAAPNALTISAKPGSAADGANGALFAITTVYNAAATSVTYTTATNNVTGVTTFTITIPSGAGASNPVAVASALNASAPFNTVLVANGTGTNDFTTATGAGPTALAGGTTVQNITLVLSQPVVPQLNMGTVTVNATVPPAAVPLGPFGNAAAPSLLAGQLMTQNPGSVINTGTTTLTYNPAGVVSFSNLALGSQTVTS
jgi:putative cell wall-binding protein